MFNLYAFYLCVNFHLSQKLDRLIRKLVLPYSKNFSDIFEKLFSSFENILSRLENILSCHENILSSLENTLSRLENSFTPLQRRFIERAKRVC